MTKARDLANFLGDNTSLGTINDAYDAGTLVPSSSNPNMVMNGAMQVAQRSTSTSTASSGYHTLDRYKLEMNGGSPTVTMSQDTASTPDTFTHALKLQVTSTATPSGFNFAQKIEGYNFSSAGFGKATAKDVTLSFWVRSSITGTYSTVLMNSSANRSYVNEYTINTADTWEKKTITIDGDTTGTWLSTTGIGLQLFFCLDNNDDSYTTSTIGSWIASNKYAGSTNQVNWAGTNGATFYMTGIKLELGSEATDFQHTSYAEELTKCHRYYQKYGGGHAYHVFFVAGTYNGNTGSGYMELTGRMRAVPTTSTSGNFGGGNGYSQDVSFNNAFGALESDGTCKIMNLRVNGTGSNYITAGFIRCRATNDITAKIEFDAEL